jgi:hypothetical protein
MIYVFATANLGFKDALEPGAHDRGHAGRRSCPCLPFCGERKVAAEVEDQLGR